ncbi:hypothetical protein QQS21_010125 [Conoideocrella luteorostrata]|uniref:Nephrocystin 3-like N-terminal domain-containing protein n=1 Tax=Conoideocrella luteorostrata TaxID=1105319 RepID=A0AAJ0FV13_9HYPO|nr:hypothetical protein QQS21_010125 [Conoideocrella luteorostrata]
MPRRVPTTCEWILEKEEYTSFCSDPLAPVFWIHGDRGSGKTTLASFITEKLDSMLRQEEVILYFFCDSGNKRRNNATSLLAGLLWRLIRLHPVLFKQIPTAYNHIRSLSETGPEDNIMDEKALWSIFLRMIRSPGANCRYCLVDGLDECDEISQAFIEESILKALGEYSNLPKFLVTSRKPPRFGLSVSLDLASPTVLPMLRQDIRALILDTTDRLIKSFSCLDLHRDDLIRVVETKSEDNFLLATLSFEDLERQFQKGGQTVVEQVLTAIPSGFSQYYDEKLGRLPPDPAIKDIILWVALAIRPLTLHELGIGIGATPRGSFTSEQVVKGYIQRCSPLLESRADSVYFVNSSAAEYVCRLLDQTSPFAVDVQGGHLQIAKRCLKYICTELSRAKKKNWGDKESQSRLPFLRYAALYFPDHAQAASSEIGQVLDLEPEFFSLISPIRELWLTVYCNLSGNSSIYPTIPVLHMVCCFGIAPIVRMLLDKGYHGCRDIEEQDDRGETALQLALKHSHYEVIEELLSRGADSNTKHRCISLNSCFLQGQNNIFNQSLEPDYISRDNGFSALHWACHQGYGAAAELLLNYEADVNALSECFVLNISYIEGDGNILNQSASHESTIDGQPRPKNVGFSALHLATLRGHEAIVKLLLDRGADIEAKIKSFAMQITVVKGDENIVNQSLEIGSGANYTVVQGDRNIVNQHNQVLQARSSVNSSFLQIDEMVVNQTANEIEEDDAERRGCSAVYLAVLNGHETVVKMLLDRGAEANEELLRQLSAISRHGVPDTSILINKLLEIQLKWWQNLSPETMGVLFAQSFLALQL